MDNSAKPTASASRLQSFNYAAKGLIRVLRYEPNVKIQLLITVAVIAAGFIFGITRFEWALIAICARLVIMAEVFNTAIETLVDFISPEMNEIAGTIKDISAGAVLLASVISLITGILIFLPYLF